MSEQMTWSTQNQLRVKPKVPICSFTFRFGDPLILAKEWSPYYLWDFRINLEEGSLLEIEGCFESTI